MQFFFFLGESNINLKIMEEKNQDSLEKQHDIYFFLSLKSYNIASRCIINRPNANCTYDSYDFAVLMRLYYNCFIIFFHAFYFINFFLHCCIELLQTALLYGLLSCGRLNNINVFIKT